jgi:hypothetical protein
MTGEPDDRIVSRRSEASACTTFDCEKPATRRLSYPTTTGRAFVGDYCDEHATEILADGWTWPGAQEVDR